MREEIAAAVVFLTRLIMKNEKLSREQVAEFSANLSAILGERFKNHWYLEDPTKGQAYRCIRINEAEPVDPVLVQAALNSGLTYKDLRLPTELTLWVDPADVCCRWVFDFSSFANISHTSSLFCSFKFILFLDSDLLYRKTSTLEFTGWTK